MSPGSKKEDSGKSPHNTGDDNAVSFALNVEPSKVLDLIVGKQTHYYTLWAGYTAVQFAVGSFGYSAGPLNQWVALAVLCGVWAFNFGHLGFVLQCMSQLEKMSLVLSAALGGRQHEYDSTLRAALTNFGEGAWFWRFFKQTSDRRNYRMNILVHLWIDLCASAALIVRVKGLIV